MIGKPIHTQPNSRTMPRVCLLLIIFLALLLPTTQPLAAQDAEQTPAPEESTPETPLSPQPILAVTAVDTSTAPSVEMRVYGYDLAGEPLDFTSNRLVVYHGGETIDDVAIIRTEDVGTTTIFLIDNPPGVAGQLFQIQEALNTYASNTYMREQFDNIAIYQVGATGAESLMAADSFYNSVRNLFADPLPSQSGPTALFDSTENLLLEVPNLKVDPASAAHIVILSDGTDVVSRRADIDAIVRTARQAGVPVHTIHLDNANLGDPQPGVDNLQEISSRTGGLYAELDQVEGVNTIWSRITATRPQTVVNYRVNEPSAGGTPVIVSLTDFPELEIPLTIELPITGPSINIDIPPDSRTLIVEDLSQPLELSIPTSYSWLDGETRGVTQAQLLINGLSATSIDPEQLERFTVELNSLNFGDNTLEVELIDSEGGRAKSPAIVLSVVQGEVETIPEVLTTPSSNTWLWWLGCIVGLFLVAGLIFLVLAGRISLFGLERALPLPGRRKAGRQPHAPLPGGGIRGTSARDSRPMRDPAGPAPVGNRPRAYLLVLESVTQMPQAISLDGVEMRIGRSPSQADIVFENDITVSRIHASLMLEATQFRIFDENSTSGTYVNQQQVPSYGLQLKDGDEILIGAVRLQFRQP